MNSMLYVDKGGYSWNGKIVPAEIFPLMSKYTLPFHKSVKSDYHKSFWYGWNNDIKTRKIISVRSRPDPPILKKIAVRSSPDPAKIGLSPDPVRSSPDPCSSLVSCRGEHGQDQDWISCRILVSFSDQDWIWIFIFEQKLDQDRMRILVWFL